MTGDVPKLILDSCAVINLYASGELASILSAHPAPAAIATAAIAELGWVGEGPRPDGSTDVETIDVAPHITSGAIAKVGPTTDLEVSLYVRFAVDLDDGEAMSTALAASRGLILVTDDRVALRVAADWLPAIATRTTPDIVKFWAESLRVKPTRLSIALQRIERRARFVPSRRHPLRDWWIGASASPDTP